MQLSRPIAVSIAGFDPSAGAGILADIKTFEQHEVYGMGICSALTRQNDSQFMGLDWVEDDALLAQLESINKFTISAFKIGIIKSLSSLRKVIVYIKIHHSEANIVLDPVLKASAGFSFHDNLEPETLMFILQNISLITPNYNEMQFLEEILGDKVVKYCNVLLKGGHNPEKEGTDILYQHSSPIEISPILNKVYPKHGSGCVLASAITANLVKGHSLEQSCRDAKAYTEAFLSSNSTLLGYHKS